MVVKTAVSLEQELFRRLESEARAQGTSRSRLVNHAVAQYLKRLENRRVTLQLNEVYSAPEEATEADYRRRMNRLYRRVLEREP